jgi:hypothetical protein
MPHRKSLSFTYSMAGVPSVCLHDLDGSTSLVILNSQCICAPDSGTVVLHAAVQSAAVHFCRCVVMDKNSCKILQYTSWPSSSKSEQDQLSESNGEARRMTHLIIRQIYLPSSCLYLSLSYIQC